MKNKLDFFFECKLFHTEKEHKEYEQLCIDTVLEMLNPVSVPKVTFTHPSVTYPTFLVPIQIDFGDASPREHFAVKEELPVLYEAWSKYPHHVKHVTFYGKFIRMETFMEIAKSLKKYYDDNKTILPFSDKEIDRELFKLYSREE